MRKILRSYYIILGVNMELKVEGKLKYLGLTRFRAIFWRPIDKFDLATSQDPFETDWLLSVWLNLLALNLNYKFILIF